MSLMMIPVIEDTKCNACEQCSELCPVFGVILGLPHFQQLVQEKIESLKAPVSPEIADLLVLSEMGITNPYELKTRIHRDWDVSKNPLPIPLPKESLNTMKSDWMCFLSEKECDGSCVGVCPQGAISMHSLIFNQKPQDEEWHPDFVSEPVPVMAEVAPKTEEGEALISLERPVQSKPMPPPPIIPGMVPDLPTFDLRNPTQERIELFVRKFNEYVQTNKDHIQIFNICLQTHVIDAYYNVPLGTAATADLTVPCEPSEIEMKLDPDHVRGWYLIVAFPREKPKGPAPPSKWWRKEIRIAITDQSRLSNNPPPSGTGTYRHIPPIARVHLRTDSGTFHITSYHGGFQFSLSIFIAPRNPPKSPTIKPTKGTDSRKRKGKKLKRRVYHVMID